MSTRAYLNPNRAGLLDVAWERGGGWISPHLLDHLKTLWKTKKFFFDFLKVYNELGKVTKFWTSRPLFSWRNSHLKKVWANSAPPAPIGLSQYTVTWAMDISTWFDLQYVKMHLAPWMMNKILFPGLVLQCCSAAGCMQQQLLIIPACCLLLDRFRNSS